MSALKFKHFNAEDRQSKNVVFGWLTPLCAAQNPDGFCIENDFVLYKLQYGPEFLEKNILRLESGLTEISNKSIKTKLFAGMVEMVDAADSKSAGFTPLRVQVSLPVPEEFQEVRSKVCSF